MNNREWFKQAKYGMMVHFGLYSLLGGEYRGRRTNSYAEWAQSYFAIPSKEYSALAKNFNPTYFNADEWIGLAKECGMQYFVITSKHHDGFALWNSKTNKYNSVNYGPGIDIVREYVDACRKHGIRVGLYFSLVNWDHEDGGIACIEDMAARERYLNFVDDSMRELMTEYGKIDILVNVAGVAPKVRADLLTMTEESYDFVMGINTKGTLFLTQAVAREMVKQGEGNIVNFSSMAAFRPMTRVAGYAAAKAGISNFTAFLATEVAKKFGEKIRVNAIAPGFFLTEQNRSLLTNPDGSWTQRGEDVIRQTPFGRMGEPEELCGTIHYLISDASKFVTGTVAVVDGGFNTFAM